MLGVFLTLDIRTCTFFVHKIEKVHLLGINNAMLISASKVNLGKCIQKKIEYWNRQSQRSHKSCQSYITLGLKNVYTTTKQILISPIKSSDRSWVLVAPSCFIITPDFFVVFTESDQKFSLMIFIRLREYFTQSSMEVLLDIVITF